MQEDYGAFVRTILTVRALRRSDSTISVLMPSQITVPIQIPATSSANPHQHVRIHTKLLRLLELYRPSYALHQNVDGRECEEKVRQSTSRAFHCGLGYLQYMSVARTPITPSANQKVERILEALARLLRPKRSQSHKSARTMMATSRPRFWAIPSASRPSKGMKAGSVDCKGQQCYGGTSVLAATTGRQVRIGECGWLDFLGSFVPTSWAYKVYPGVGNTLTLRVSPTFLPRLLSKHVDDPSYLSLHHTRSMLHQQAE